MVLNIKLGLQYISQELQRKEAVKYSSCCTLGILYSIDQVEDCPITRLQITQVF